MRAQIEGEIALPVRPGCVVLHLDGAWIAIISEAMLLILEGDAVLHNMVYSDFLSTQLEAVAVTVRRRCSVGGLAIMVSNAIANGYNPNRTCVRLGIEIPAVIDVVSRYTAIEYVAWSNGQLGCEAISIFSVVWIIIIMGIGIDNLIVAWPFIELCR
ncbi:hypothetical protein D3C77_511990 [compost metagenome]